MNISAQLVVGDSVPVATPTSSTLQYPTSIIDHLIMKTGHCHVYGTKFGMFSYLNEMCQDSFVSTCDTCVDALQPATILINQQCRGKATPLIICMTAYTSHLSKHHGTKLEDK